MKKLLLGIVATSMLLTCFVSPSSSQAQRTNATELRPAVPRIDTLTLLLRHVGRLSRTYLTLAETTSTLSRRSVFLSENLVLLTRNDSEVTARLDKLADGNIVSSDRLSSLGKSISVLTWAIVLFGALQIVLFAVSRARSSQLSSKGDENPTARVKSAVDALDPVEIKSVAAATGNNSRRECSL